MITLSEAKENIGAGVVYEITCGVCKGKGLNPKSRSWPCDSCSGDGIVKREDGVITSVNDTYVFVRYTGNQSSKATYPKDLNFLLRKT